MQGHKLVEYRCWKPSCGCPFHVLIYSTRPVGIVVGEFSVYNVIEGTKDYVWKMTSDIGGVSEANFMKYFNNKEHCYAFLISNLHIYKKPVSLIHIGINNPPQKFLYV